METKVPYFQGKVALAAASLLTFLTTFAQARDNPAALRIRAKEFFEPLPAQTPGAENDSRALVLLGKRLYFDTRFSANHSPSCNSCNNINEPGIPYLGPSLKERSFSIRAVRSATTVLCSVAMDF